MAGITKEEQKRRAELLAKGIKVCNKCKRELPVEQFSKNKRTKDGLNGKCKECGQQYQQQYDREHKEKRQQYRQEHKEKLQQYNQQYQQQNKEKLQQKRKQYREEHKEEKRQYMQQYYQQNKEKLQQYDKQYYQQNKEQKQQYNKQYWKDNKDKLSVHNKEYREQNKERILEKHKQYDKEHKEEKRQYMQQYYEEHKEELLQYGRKRNKQWYEDIKNGTRKVSPQKTQEQFIEEVEQLNQNIEVLEDYQGAKVKIKFRCKVCGYIWETKPNTLLNGTGCPKCNNSKGEQQITQYLDNNEVEYIYDQCYFNDLVGIGGGLMRPDFIIPSLRLWIEYDGEQHYYPIDFTSKMSEEQVQEQFKKVQQNDQIKNQYAKDNNWTLIRIPYYDYDNIEQILDAVLKQEQAI